MTLTEFHRRFNITDFLGNRSTLFLGAFGVVLARAAQTPPYGEKNYAKKEIGRR